MQRERRCCRCCSFRCCYNSLEFFNTVSSVGGKKWLLLNEKTFLNYLWKHFVCFLFQVNSQILFLFWESWREKLVTGLCKLEEQNYDYFCCFYTTTTPPLRIWFNMRFFKIFIAAVPKYQNFNWNTSRALRLWRRKRDARDVLSY